MTTTLRLTQIVTAPDTYRIEFALEQVPRMTATAEFQYQVSAETQERIRWYLEEYPKALFKPDTELAKQVEKQIHTIGTVFFRTVFEANRDTQRLWDRIIDHVQDVRIEIETTVEAATALPWELLRDPTTDLPLALRAESFVRVQQEIAVEPKIPKLTTDGSAIRVLLVIARPDLGDDVAFRSVGAHLVKLTATHEDFALSVLRPPTWEQLGRVLRAAKHAGQPFHVVHFDGHGVYAERDQIKRAFGSHQYADQRDGKHGYLAFENPRDPANTYAVSVTMIGQLLRETDVPVLLLNACRSAYGENAEGRMKNEENQSTNLNLTPNPQSLDPHATVRAFGSLAQEVMDAGVAGVLAMRYNVYVVTAMQYVAELYHTLVNGATLGTAATLARKQLHDQPRRDINGKAVELQDWLVPIIYEAAPIQLFPRKASDTLNLKIIANAATPASRMTAELPHAPDIGFIGRDETLIALDRACDQHNVILLHAYAGNGKTTTAAEFARWYVQTGGTDAVLWTTFEGDPKPLQQVLSVVEAMFAPLLQQSGIEWLALPLAQRIDVTRQIFQQIRVLWVWDNVEPIAGFPAGTPSRWTASEQRDLADFLRVIRGTQARMILTSRRDEQAWLGDLPMRIAMPVMAAPDRVAMVRAMASKQGVTVHDPAPWRPLLAYSLGNPLTLTVLIGQALRAGLHTGDSKDKIEKFVEQLRSGEAGFEDDASQGREKSLGASLSYGFSTAFTDSERAQLALLHLFQGFVDVDTLRIMGDSDAEWCLPILRGMSRETGINLLDRAAEIGLLTSFGDGFYQIHPALPWYFKHLFETYWGNEKSEIKNQKSEYTLTPNPYRAFVEAMGELGDYYHNQYGAGNRAVINVLQAEEANLLHARRLAIQHEWWDAIISTMQGLRNLYDHTGRRTAWKQVVDEIVSLFDADDRPLPQREEQWSLVTSYRVDLAQESRDWQKAARLQKVSVDWNRTHASSALSLEPAALTPTQRNQIRTLAASLAQLGQIQSEQGQAECVASYQEATMYYQQIGDRGGEAVAAYNLGRAYMQISSIRDLAQAERWYQHSLDLRDKQDRLGQGKCHNQLGLVAYERFKELRATDQPDQTELLHLLNQAVQYYHQALELLPANAYDALAVTHNQLGNIYNAAGDLNRAVWHYRESVRYEEAQGNFYGAGQTRFNIALRFYERGRYGEALPYAEEALRNYEVYGAGAAADVVETQGLIENIKRDMTSPRR